MTPLARGAAAALARSGGTRALDAVWGERLTVLLYHRIADPDDPGFVGHRGTVSATPEGFLRQMRYVAGRFDVIALDDLLAFLDGGRPLPPRALLVTFDDGYADNHAHALPVLRELGLPAVEFVVTGAIGTDHVPWWDECAQLLGRTAACDDATEAIKRLSPERREAAMAELRRRAGTAPERPRAPLFMDWDQVAELERHGVSCQPHTHSHPILTTVGPDRAREELTRSKAIIERRLGRPATAFAFPNGTARDYDAGTLATLRRSGYRVAFTTRTGPVRPDDARGRPMELPRIAIDAADGVDAFRLKVHGLTPVVARLRRPRSGLAR